MAFKSFGVLVLTGSPQRLLDIAGGAAAGAKEDLPLAQLFLQPQADAAAVIYVGDGPTLTAGTCGFEIAKPASSIPPVPFSIGPFPLGIIKLSQIWVLGTAGDDLHVSGVVA